MTAVWETEVRDEIGRWFHGTRAVLAPGDLVTPGHESSLSGYLREHGIAPTQATDTRDRTFFSDSPETARRWAVSRGDPRLPIHVYEVEPSGQYETDPGGGEGDYRSHQALRVVREVRQADLSGGGISSQLVAELAAWQHEARAPDGRWIHGIGSQLRDAPTARLTPASSDQVAPGIKQLTFKGFPKPAGKPAGDIGHLSPAVRHLADITEEQLAAGETTMPRQGIQGVTRIVTLPGGEKVVDKTYSDFPIGEGEVLTAKEMADRDELTYYVSQAIGAGAPPVQRRAENRVLMGYVPGKTGAAMAMEARREAEQMARQYDPNTGADLDQAVSDAGNLASSEFADSLINTPEGELIGLLDYLTGNRDRHGGNFMVHDGKPVPIDHSSSRYDAHDPQSMFEAELTSEEWDGEQMSEWRSQLRRTQPEFIRLGQPAWYANMMSQLEDLGSGPISRERYRALLSGKSDGSLPVHSSDMSISSQLRAIELAGGWKDAWLHELRGPHGEWIKGPPHAYELPDPSRLHSERARYKDPSDHPFFQRNPVSPQHIAESYDASTPQERAQGMRWYADAHDVALALTPGDPEKGAGLLSAYSPQTSWPVNMLNAARSVSAGRAIGPGEGMITGNMQKTAQKMLDGGKIPDVFKSPKTLAFARLIMHGADPEDEKLGNVVIDRHALSVAVGRRLTKDDVEDSPIDTDRFYQHVADQYRLAAAAVSKRDGAQITPHQLQAITWLHQQGSNQNIDATGRETSVAGGEDNRLGRGRATALRNAWAGWQNWDWQHNVPSAIGTTSLPGSAMAEEVRHSPDRFSVSMATGKGPKTGYMVAMNDHTETFPAEVMQDKVQLAAAIDSYLMNNAGTFNNESMFLGGWVHDGKLWLEPSQNVTDHDEAVQLAQQRNQIAVWDVAGGQEIQTGGAGGGKVIEHGAGGADTEGHFGPDPGQLQPAVTGGAQADLARACRAAPAGTLGRQLYELAAISPQLRATIRSTISGQLRGAK